jgi:hypothetical protein
LRFALNQRRRQPLEHRLNPRCNESVFFA